MKQKIALITGITGQDGAYLADFLLKKGYFVFGAFRRSSSINFWRLEYLNINLHENLSLVEYDLTDMGSALRLLKKVKPNDVYNLAAQYYVGVSFDQPSTTSFITALGVLNLLEAIRIVDPSIRFYQASSSEMFGKVQATPQNENTAFHPRSPYGIAKLYGHWTTINYNESYGIYAVSGILFNHESPLRGKEFVTRKITDAVARIKLKIDDHLEIGNLDAKRDWGYAKEYVEGMWLMLQKESPSSYVLASGKVEKVRDFVKMAFDSVDIDIKFEGKDESEVAFEVKTGKVLVRVNPLLFRPAEVDILLGDSSKAKEELGWSVKTNISELCEMMVKADLIRNQKGNSF